MQANYSLIWQALIAAAAAVAVAYIRYQTKTLRKIARVTEQTHILVNSNMGIQLRINAVATRRLSLMTGAADDIEAANLAERLYLEHQTKQAVVDKSLPFQEVHFKQPKT